MKDILSATFLQTFHQFKVNTQANIYESIAALINKKKKSFGIWNRKLQRKWMEIFTLALQIDFCFRDLANSELHQRHCSHHAAPVQGSLSFHSRLQRSAAKAKLLLRDAALKSSFYYWNERKGKLIESFSFIVFLKLQNKSKYGTDEKVIVQQMCRTTELRCKVHSKCKESKSSFINQRTLHHANRKIALGIPFSK